MTPCSAHSISSANTAAANTWNRGSAHLLKWQHPDVGAEEHSVHSAAHGPAAAASGTGAGPRQPPRQEDGPRVIPHGRAAAPRREFSPGSRPGVFAGPGPCRIPSGTAGTMNARPQRAPTARTAPRGRAPQIVPLCSQGPRLGRVRVPPPRRARPRRCRRRRGRWGGAAALCAPRMHQRLLRGKQKWRGAALGPGCL